MESMAGFLKLRGKPVKVELFTKYRPVEPFNEKEPKFEGDPEMKVEPWMHYLTSDQLHEVEAVGIEAFRAFQAKGANDNDALWKSLRVERCLHVMLCLKRGPEENAQQLFETPEEMTVIPYQEVNRIVSLYYETFRPSGEEIKNSLRERLGDGSKTESSSPSASATPA